MKYKCPCCENYTFNTPAGGTFYICEVCYWEDDGYQLTHPDKLGANSVCLNDAKKNYLKFGACEKNLLKYVRKPLQSESSYSN